MNSSEKITSYIDGLNDWRSSKLEDLREIINSFSELKEDFKWGVPVWTYNGMVCAISGFKDHVKINFFKGSRFTDQSAFNSGLDSKDHRSINFGPEDNIDEKVIRELLLQAIKSNKKS